MIVSLVPGVAGRSFWNISPRSATSSGHMRSDGGDEPLMSASDALPMKADALGLT